MVMGASGCETEIRTMNRSISALGVCLLLGAAAFPDALQDRPTLKDVFKDAFMMGTAVNGAIWSGSDAQSRDIVVRQFASITPENVMKAGSINPRPGVFNFGPADAFVEFGEKHDMFIVGHTLVWHNQTPSWFSRTTRPAELAEAQKEVLRRHIETVAGRYGRIHAWDVVNEVIEKTARTGPRRGSSDRDGDELVKLAFRFRIRARRRAYYNDFNAWRPAKRDGIVRMVKMLKAAASASTGSASKATGASTTQKGNTSKPPSTPTPRWA